MGKNQKRRRKSAEEETYIIPEREEPLKMKASRLLAAMYLIAVAVRFLLGLAFTHGPTVIIDENLYIGIAKSLAFEGKIAYRCQPVDYFSIFYPLLLVPLFRIKLPFDLYRTIQLYNCFLMCSSAFPAYKLSKKFTGSEKKAIAAAGITLLMPDMKLASHLMSECVVWPLTIWVFWFAYNAFSEKENCLKNSILAGGFSALLFWTKPGSFVFGAAILAVLLFFAAKDKDSRMIRSALAGLGVLAGMIGIFYMLYVFVFGYEMSVLGLYDKQLSKLEPMWVAGSAESAVLQVVLLALAAGGVYAVVPFAYLKEYNREERRFIIAAAAGIGVTAIGTALFVVMYGWNRSFVNIQLHLRYMAMFIPILFIFSQPIACRKNEPERGIIIALLAVAALYIFPGARVGSVRGESTQVDSMALNAYLDSWRISGVWGVIVTIICVMTIIFICMELKRGLNPGLKVFCAGYFAVFLLINNVCTYIAGNVDTAGQRTADAREINELIEREDSPVLGVTQQYYDNIKTFWQEVHTRKTMHQVTIDNILFEAMNTGGVYVPFVPVEQAPTINNVSTPDTDVLLLGETVAEHMELSSAVSAVKSTNGFYTLAHIQKGERWLDSGLFGINNDTLVEGKTAYLDIYDESRIDENGNVHVNITAKAEKEGTVLKASSGGTTAEIALSTELLTYPIVLPNGKITMDAVGGDVEITTYTTATGE